MGVLCACHILRITVLVCSVVHDLGYALESPGELKYPYLVHHRLIKSESMGPDLQNVLKVLLRDSNMKPR